MNTYLRSCLHKIVKASKYYKYHDSTVLEPVRPGFYSILQLLTANIIRLMHILKFEMHLLTSHNSSPLMTETLPVFQKKISRQTMHKVVW